MRKSKPLKRLLDAYRFPGFRLLAKVRGVFGDPYARVIRLVRRSKKQSVATVVPRSGAGTTVRYGKCATCLAERIGSIWCWKSAESAVGGAAR